ncbi:hypothetical protein NX029_26355 [Cytobacillus firmus]|nr:hypothetical protein [Cytobacillus firmus]
MRLSGKFKVVAVKKKTSAVFFKDLKEGDEFSLSYDLNGGYGYAPSILIRKGTECHWNNGLQLRTNLAKFEVEQVV